MNLSGGRIVPIIDITEKMHLFKRVFGHEVYDLLHASKGYQAEEDYTFTFRMSLDLSTEEGRTEREYIMTRLRSLQLPGAEALIELFESNDWDVSFFADFF